MARKWSNQNLPGALHFVTGNVFDRMQIFKKDDCCHTFIKVCSDLLKEWPCKLIAYVLMPDHIHMVVNPRDGRIKEFIGRLKWVSAISIVDSIPAIKFKMNSDGVHQIWQESFKAIPLWSAWMIWQKINYIHANPVKAGLAKSARDYPWSSFKAFYEGTNEPLPVDHEWWWPEDSEKLSKAMKELGWRTFEKRN